MEFRDLMVWNATEMRLAMDYASSRPDIDTTRFAYYAVSFGVGSRLPFAAVEPRFRAVVLLGAGIDERVQPTLPEAANFLTSPSDVELEPEFVTQPDIYVVPMSEWRRLNSADEDIVRELPLCIEILSPSSARHDRVRKRPLYQRHVPDYWIVDLDSRLFERWTREPRPELVTDTLVWHPAGAATPFTLDVSAYFQRVLDG